MLCSIYDILCTFMLCNFHLPKTFSSMLQSSNKVNDKWMGIRLMYVVLSYIMVRCSISNNSHCLLPLWKVSVVIPHIHVNSLFHIWQILFTVQAVYTWMYWYLTSNCFTAQTYITYLGHFAIWIKVNICLGHLCYCLTLL